MNSIAEIHSIELDRSKVFNHVIKMKNKNGITLEEIPVKDSNGFEQLTIIVKAWSKHPQYSGE